MTKTSSLLILIPMTISWMSCAASGESEGGLDVAASEQALLFGGGKHRRATALERLGMKLFFDERLSVNRNQSCAACHGAEVGWTGPDEELNRHGAVYEGSVPERFGNRKPPSSAYAAFAPVFSYDPQSGFMGGNFWDGRATGFKLGNPAADQAQGPFLNPVEQALPNAATLLARVCKGPYARLFRRVWSARACRNVEQGFADIALSIAAFEGSATVSPFRSKYDAVLAGRARLTLIERQGLELFEGKAHCAECHTSAPGPAGEPPLFTDFGYNNIGVPKNPENPFYEMDEVFVDGEPINPLGDAWIDRGLAEFVEALAATDDWRALPYVSASVAALSSSELSDLVDGQLGRQKVPTLRNVAKRPSPDFVKAYTHNGYFKSLRGLVHFYNTRDVLATCPGDFTMQEALAADCWPSPEVLENMETEQMGELGLSDSEEEALVAFLETLSD